MPSYYIPDSESELNEHNDDERANYESESE